MSSSGGNAGLAAAYCARELGLPITVVVPQTTPSFIVDKLREEGASVEVVGKVRPGACSGCVGGWGSYDSPCHGNRFGRG